MTLNDYQFSLEFIVRDYECDFQGVVNNANYQHYLEHARSQFLNSEGVDILKLHEDGIDLIVTKVEIEYKYPLRSRDKFVVRLNIQREGNIRLLFLQDIFRLSDNKLIVKAKVTGVAIKNGKPTRPVNIISQLGLD